MTQNEALTRPNANTLSSRSFDRSGEIQVEVNADMITTLNVSLIITTCVRVAEMRMSMRKSSILRAKFVKLKRKKISENQKKRKNLGTFHFSVCHLTSMEKVRGECSIFFLWQRSRSRDVLTNEIQVMNCQVLI